MTGVQTCALPIWGPDPMGHEGLPAPREISEVGWGGPQRCGHHLWHLWRDENGHISSETAPDDEEAPIQRLVVPELCEDRPQILDPPGDRRVLQFATALTAASEVESETGEARLGEVGRQEEVLDRSPSY